MKKYNANDPAAVEAVAKCLLEGGVAVIPTETVYGIVTRYDNEAGYDRIYAMKRRPASKRLQMLAPSLECAIDNGVRDTPEIRNLARHFWPGALTVVALNRTEDDSIGLRIPDHPFVLNVLQCCGTVLAATSANRSGEPAAINFEDAIADLDGEPDVAVDGGTITAVGQASTVVSLLNSAPAIIREGKISLDELKKALFG